MNTCAKLLLIFVTITVVAVLTSCTPTATSPRRSAAPVIPFSLDVATVPDSVDQQLLMWEFWRTRKGLADGLVDTTGDAPEARVSLVQLDMFVTPLGLVDSVTVVSPRMTPRMISSVRQVVRTWYLGDHGSHRRYRFTVPMSAHMTNGYVGGPVDPEKTDHATMRAIITEMIQTRRSLAECYRAYVPQTDSVAAYHDETLVVRIVAGENGVVRNAAVVESMSENTQIDSCLACTIRTWRLPVTAEGAYEFPLRFNGVYESRRVTQRNEQDDGV